MIRARDYKKQIETLKMVSYLSQIGFAVIFCILLFFLVGNYLDNLLDTGSLFLVLGILTGVFAGGWSAYRIIQDMDKKFGPSKNGQGDEKK